MDFIFNPAFWLTELLTKKPASSVGAALLLGLALGTFAPASWVLWIGVGIGAIFLVSLVLFGLIGINGGSGAIAAFAFVAPMVLGGILLVAMGGAFYLATGQNFLQLFFAGLRGLTGQH